MMGTLADKSPPLKLPVKRSLGQDEFQGRGFPPKFKHPKVNAFRQYPRNCGQLAPPVGKMRFESPANEEEGKPSVLLLESAKPLVAHGKVLNDVEIGSLTEVGKAELQQVSSNGSKTDAIYLLGSPESSSLPRSYATKYALPKMHKGVNAFRNYPPGCGRQTIVSSYNLEVVGNKNAGVEDRPLEGDLRNASLSLKRSIMCPLGGQLEEKNLQEIASELHEKSYALGGGVEAKYLQENGCKLQVQSTNVLGDVTCKLVQGALPSESEGKEEEDREKISVMSSLGRDFLQSYLKCSSSINKDARGKRDSGDVALDESDLMIRSNEQGEWATLGMEADNKLMGTTLGSGKHDYIEAKESKNIKLDEVAGLDHNVTKDKAVSTGVEADNDYMGPAICSREHDSIGAKESNNSKLDESAGLDHHSIKEKAIITEVEAANHVKHDFSTAARASNDLSRDKVTEALKLFKELYNKLLMEHKAKSKGEGKVGKHIHVEAAMTLKRQHKWVNANEPILGAVPGVNVGDKFEFRVELVMIGLHCQHMAGIDYINKDGKRFATSVVASGRYANGTESSDVLIYSGQGGNPNTASKQPEDQKLERGNLALKNSMDERIPVRVIRKKMGYVYDGLYVVSNYWTATGPYGKLVFMFQLNKILGQLELAPSLASSSIKSKVRSERCVVDDISQGREKMHIRAMNAIDDEKPPPFNYITSMIYPKFDDLITPSGCNCIKGCSDSKPCFCLIKNGGEVPFNKNGAILEQKTMVYECGPSCKCPPSCKNRVSQHGVRYQLEIFKTESRGWGVRSRKPIPSGSFICEYAGELLDDKEAEERTGYDEYLFDIGKDNGSDTQDGDKLVDDDGFAIDAAHFGNIGRFVNHSCSPNLYAQDVLYDHDDKRMPHVMLFAAEDIPPLQELTYDYNYTMGQVLDANGDIKKKNCYCGASDCTGRMY